MADVFYVSASKLALETIHVFSKLASPVAVSRTSTD
jgi:hypothetical protein